MHMVAEYFLFEMFMYCKGRQGTEGGEGERSGGWGGGVGWHREE